MVGPLIPSLGEECVAKVILVEFFAGGVARSTNGGSNTPNKSKKNRDFDPTKGFAGQDITSGRWY